jgi:sRNA-binding protein
MSTTLHEALASVGLAPTDSPIPASDLASEPPRSKKLRADDFTLYQRLATAFPVCFDLQHPVPLMHNIDAAIRHHRDFSLVSVTSLGRVLAFVTGRRQYWLCLTRKGARRHSLDGTPLDPVEPDVRRAAAAELARLKTKRPAGKV